MMWRELRRRCGSVGDGYDWRQQIATDLVGLGGVGILAGHVGDIHLMWELDRELDRELLATDGWKAAGKYDGS